MTELAAALRVLQILVIVLTILGITVPVALAALFWKISKEFPTKKDLDGFGGRLTIAEKNIIEANLKADLAIQRLDRTETKLEVEMKYIRRDLDTLLSHFSEHMKEER